MEVYQSSSKKINVKDLFAGKKGILFALPGAFTPTCSEVSWGREEGRVWNGGDGEGGWIGSNSKNYFNLLDV